MKTALDTNILLDIFLPDPVFGIASRDALARQFADGALLVGEIVYSELAGFFPKKSKLDEALQMLGVSFVSSDKQICYLAGEAWKNYRKRGGPRQRVLADFLIGAHADVHADALLTRDRGYYKKYFPQLTILEP